jgi:hypothetical protein
MVCHAQGISPADDGDKQMSMILPTENQDWGFWGTMREHAQQVWPIAFTAIHNATSTDPASVRAFLDSRYGRHCADGVNGQMHYGASLADEPRAWARRSAEGRHWRIRPGLLHRWRGRVAPEARRFIDANSQRGAGAMSAGVQQR